MSQLDRERRLVGEWLKQGDSFDRAMARAWEAEMGVDQPGFLQSLVEADEVAKATTSHVAPGEVALKSLTNDQLENAWNTLGRFRQKLPQSATLEELAIDLPDRSTLAACIVLGGVYSTYTAFRFGVGKRKQDLQEHSRMNFLNESLKILLARG